MAFNVQYTTDSYAHRRWTNTTADGRDTIEEAEIEAFRLVQKGMATEAVVVEYQPVIVAHVTKEGKNVSMDRTPRRRAEVIGE